MEIADDVRLKMMDGNKDAILSCLYSEATFLKVNAIFKTVEYKHIDHAIINKIVELQKDYSLIDVTSISQFATAALAIMGIKEYTGDDQHILDLISTRFDFG